MIKFKWLSGRHSDETEYKTYCFLEKRIWKFGIDGYLIKYKPNTVLYPHTDPVENGDHYRFNIELKGKGEFYCKNKILSLFNNRIVLFRPDKEKHSVVNGKQERLVLSIGFVKYK